MNIISVILDLVLVGLVAFIIIRYSIRGFVKSFVSVLKILLAPFIAIIFTIPLARLISSWGIDSAMKGWAKGYLLNLDKVVLPNGETAYDLSKVTWGKYSRGIIDFLLEIGNADSQHRDLINKHITGFEGGPGPVPATVADIENISDFLGNILALLFAAVIAFVVIFIIVEVIVLIFSKLIDKLLRKAVTAKRLDILLGAIIGIFVAMLTAWVISYVIGKLFDLGHHHYPDKFKVEYVEDAIFLKFFVDHDLWEFIKKIAIK